MATEVSRRKVRLQDAANFEVTLVTYDDGSVGMLGAPSTAGTDADSSTVRLQADRYQCRGTIASTAHRRKELLDSTGT